GVHFRSQPLDDYIRKIVLEVLGHARYECHTDRGQQQQASPADELSLGVLVILGGVSIDDVAENDRVKQRKNLISRGQEKRNNKEFPVLRGVSVEKFHGRRWGHVGD